MSGPGAPMRSAEPPFAIPGHPSLNCRCNTRGWRIRFRCPVSLDLLDVITRFEGGTITWD